MLRSVDVHDHPGREVVAGITVAAVAVPGVIGYAHIAGMPIATGLYTMIIPATVFVILCSSRHLVVGADSTTAAILAAGLTPLAAVGSAEYVELAAMVAILTGAMLLVARLAGLGFISDFLSRTLLIGFLAGVGVQVAVSQVPAALGVTVTASGPIPTLVAVGHHLSEVVTADVALSVASVAVIAVGGWLWSRVPWPLLVVVAGIAASATGAIDVATIPDVTGGLPLPSWPAVHDLDRVASLLPVALMCFVVVLAQSSATARAYAERHGERVDADEDLVALGAANLAAGLTGTFVVNGSPTRTEMMHGAGGRNQAAQLVAAAVTVVVLLTAGPVLTYLPTAVLASVVAMIAIRLIDVPAVTEVFRRRRAEGLVVIATAVTVIAAGVGPGLLFAMGLSVVVHLRHSYRPNVRALGRDRDRPDVEASGAAFVAARGCARRLTETGGMAFFFCRLKPQPTMPILASTTGLPNKLSFYFTLITNSFTIRHLRLANVSFDFEFTLHAINDDFQVEFTHTRNDRFFGFRIS